MFKRTLWLTALSACLVLLMASLSFGFDFTKLEESVTEHTLDNGLKVIVMERHDAPVVSFITYANVGGANDPKEYTGLAHMFEHMAFKGTNTTGTTDLESELKAMAREDSGRLGPPGTARDHVSGGHGCRPGIRRYQRLRQHP